MVAGPVALCLVGEEAADRLLSANALALLVGMLLDQQMPMERAFRAPLLLSERLGGAGHDHRTLDAAAIAAVAPQELAEAFARPPALHRYHGSMARRTSQLCRHLVERYGGRPEAVWEGVDDAGDLLVRLRALPGFGDQKARIFLALLAKRLGVRPAGWREASAPYGEPGAYLSVADVAAGASDIARVRAAREAARTAAPAAKGEGAAPAAGER